MAQVDTITGEVVQPLDEAQARELTDRIKETVESLWFLLLESYERRAWAALGYSSWREYATVEFEVSESRAYQYLDSGRVVRALEAMTVSTVVETQQTPNRHGITEREARRLKPELHLVKEEVAEQVAKGADPVEAVEAAVAKRRLPTPTQARQTARDTGKGVVASDGLIYDSRSEAEIQAEVDRNERSSEVIESLEALSAMYDTTPKDLIGEFPDVYDHIVDEHLERAFAWLSAFRHEWRNRGK